MCSVDIPIFLKRKSNNAYYTHIHPINTKLVEQVNMYTRSSHVIVNATCTRHSN